MSMLDFEDTGHIDLSEPYKAFVRQLSDWYNGGELPELAGQDLCFTLELQRQKLQSLGLDMQCTIKNTGYTKVDGISLSDRVFTNTIVTGDMGMTRSVGSNQKQLYQNTEDVWLTAVIQSLRKDTQPGADMTLCCPHCGAPSTLGKLKSGCQYCGTRFLMSELYPKVMNYFVNERYDREKDSAKNKHDLAVLITACILPMTVIGIVSNLFFVHQTTSTAVNLIYGILAGIMSGGMIGCIVFGFKKLLEVLGLMKKGLRGGTHTVSTLLNANKIKKHDPEFSSEYFRDKIMSLFKMAVYSKDASALACCKCQCPERAADIIEAQLFNFNINNCQITDQICDAEVTLFLDCLHVVKGKIQSKTDKFRMRIRKHIKSPTELGFSFAAARCPSCGASFDARNVKACPYCGSAYLHEELDWIVTDIS